jgi:hypothetical protein
MGSDSNAKAIIAEKARKKSDAKKRNQQVYFRLPSAVHPATVFLSQLRQSSIFPRRGTELPPCLLGMLEFKGRRTVVRRMAGYSDAS